MSSISFRKVKSVAKDVYRRDAYLNKLVLKTMEVISDLVGATLGPGGQPILIERQETGLPNLVTKDGVTVFRSLGFNDATMHAIMETARDAAIRTATEAGDGTTTASILSEAFVRLCHEFLDKNPKSSPQKVVRAIENVFRTYLEPFLKEKSKVFKVQESREMQEAVVMCSTNGDAELSTSVMECFRITGDEGNVTILEKSGPSHYEVEALKGYPITVGYEESCKRFFTAFINDNGLSRVYLEKPRFILYYGQLSEIQPLMPLIESINAVSGTGQPTNFVILATGFGDSLVADLAANFGATAIKIFPLLIPRSIITNGEMNVLQDLQALTGAKLFDPLSCPIDTARLEDLGAPLDYFESLRYRSNIIGRNDEDLLLARVEEVRRALEAPESEYDRMMTQERLAKLTGGIAKLTVFGASSGETREKRDRAEDATCALRGALKSGVLPGGGWGLVSCIQYLRQLMAAGTLKGVEPVVSDVLIPALAQPVERLMSNAGFNDEEIHVRLATLVKYVNKGEPIVWDGMLDRFIDATEAGVMDSLPAVIEALRNSISIATLLGTLGGTIVFQRDREIERKESEDAYHFLRNSNVAEPV